MKVYVAAPGQHNWPVIPDEIQEQLLVILNEHFDETKLQISLKRPRKKQKTDEVTSKHPIKQHLAIGLRTVLRCLKQNRCCLTLVCTSLVPLILTKPILLLSQMHSIPAARIRNLSSTLTRIFAIPHCSIIAFKSSAKEHLQLKDLVDSLVKSINGSGESTPMPLTFVPGKVIAPYQNPTRIAAGGVTKKKKKTKTKPKK